MVASTTMPVDIWFHIFTGTIFISLVLALFPVYKILKHMCCTATPNNGISDKQYSINISPPDEDQSCWSKFTLIASVLSFFLFIAFQSFDGVIQYVHISTINNNYCKLALIVYWGLYIMAKFFLITYFIFRAYDSFKRSQYSFNAFFLCITYPAGILIAAFIIIPLGWIALKDISFVLDPVYINNKQYGTQCGASYTENAENRLWFIYGIGAFIDIIFTIFSVSLLMYKFSVIIQESAKQQSLIDTSGQSDHNRRAQQLLDGSIEIDEPNKSNVSIPGSHAIDPDQVCEFHIKTKNENRWLLLMTKLLVLLMIEAISTAIAFGIYYLSKVYYFGYVLDAMICIYCLFASFEFSDYYYYELCFGFGYKCSKFCFPCTKTSVITLRCLNQDCCGPDAFCWCNNKCLRIFCTCNCGGCCFCCQCYGYCCKSCYGKHQMKQRQMYIMAKSEVDLLLATLTYKQKERKDSALWN